MPQWLKRIAQWFAKEVGRAALSPITKWVTAIVGSVVLPAIWLWARRGLTFFATTHPVPGWVVSFGATAVLLSLGIVLWQRAEIRRLRPVREKGFLYGGLAWVLAEPFWSNWRNVMVDQMAPEFLRSAVLGPFCKTCKVDVFGYLSTANQLPHDCPRCTSPFDWSGEMSVNAMREVVYLEAQAAARREPIRAEDLTSPWS